MKTILQDIIFSDTLEKDILIVSSVFDESTKKGETTIDKICLHFLPSPFDKTQIFKKEVFSLKELLFVHKKLTTKKDIKTTIYLKY